MLRRSLRALRSSASTVLVLGLITALAVWGHRTRWKVPTFSDLVGGAPEPTPAAPGSPQPRAAPASGGELATVTFDNSEAVRQNGLELAEAVARPLEEHVAASGTVGYNRLRLAQLSSRVPGHVWAVRTQPGQAVNKGAVLALIDSEEVGRAKADFLQETFTAWHRARQLERMRAVRSSIPERNLREAEAALRESEVKRFNARQRLLNLGFPLDLNQDPAQPLDRLAGQLQFLGLPPEVIAELSPRPATANLIPLKAPFDGVVVRQDLVAGEVVDPGKPQVVLADVRTMWVRLSVRKEDADRLDLGQRVEFLGEGLTEPVVGRLSWVSTEIDETTRTVQARCEVDNPPRVREGKPAAEGLRRLRANLFGTARIRVASHAAAVVVPDAAVQRLPDLTPVVFVRREDGLSFQPRKVRLGLSRDGLTHVLDGVRAGERVVTRGSFVLKSELMKDTLSAG
jgi:membrane fusion protein, heavy metal efflux system